VRFGRAPFAPLSPEGKGWGEGVAFDVALQLWAMTETAALTPRPLPEGEGAKSGSHFICEMCELKADRISSARCAS